MIFWGAFFPGEHFCREHFDGEHFDGEHFFAREHFVLGSIFWRAFGGEHLAGSIWIYTNFLVSGILVYDTHVLIQIYGSAAFKIVHLSNGKTLVSHYICITL